MTDRSNDQQQILLVEDEPVISMYIESALRESGFSVFGPFDTVASSMDAAGQFDGCAALVDLMLKGVDATAVTEILARRNIPYVVMTGSHSTGSEVANGPAVLRKPFVITDLIETVRGVCPTPSP